MMIKFFLITLGVLLAVGSVLYLGRKLVQEWGVFSNKPLSLEDRGQPELVLTEAEKAKGWEIREKDGVKFKALPFKSAMRALLGD